MVGLAGIASKDAGFHHLITSARPWYKNPRLFFLIGCEQNRKTHLKGY